MITEGLLLYLPSATVEALASEASSHSSVAYWISDITTTTFSRILSGGADTTQPIRHVQASDALKGEQILEVLQPWLGNISNAKLYRRCWIRNGSRAPRDGRR
jgi:hypothetical protein